MSLFLIAFFFLSILASGRDILIKQSTKKIDPNTIAFSGGLLLIIISGIVLVREGMPKSLTHEFLLPLFSGGILYYFGKYFNFTALTLGDISLITPLKGWVTLFSVISSFLLLNQLPTVLGFLGIMGIIIGTYIIGMEKGNITLFAPFISLWKNPASRIYLVSIVCYGFVVTIDQIGVRQSSFWFWTFCMNIAVVLFCLPSMIQNRRDFIESIRSGYLALGGAIVLHALVYGAQMYLVAYIQAPYLSAFKTSSALFSVLLGGWFFRESHLLKRTLGALLITIGIIFMSFYG